MHLSKYRKKFIFNLYINDITVFFKPEFVKATLEAKNLKQRPSNVDMLNLYALYKQSIFGDCNIGMILNAHVLLFYLSLFISVLLNRNSPSLLTKNAHKTLEKPPLTDIQGRAKWEAWNRLKGTSRSEGQKQYINLVQNLRVK